MRYYPELPSRFVIIPRHTSGDSVGGVMFVDTDPCHVSSNHSSNQEHACSEQSSCADIILFQYIYQVDSMLPCVSQMTSHFVQYKKSGT